MDRLITDNAILESEIRNNKVNRMKTFATEIIDCTNYLLLNTNTCNFPEMENYTHDNFLKVIANKAPLVLELISEIHKYINNEKVAIEKNKSIALVMSSFFQYAIAYFLGKMLPYFYFL